MTRAALITGASGGLGREFAALCARDGRDLIIVARDGERLRQMKERLEQRHSVTIMPVALDLSGPDAARRLVDEVDASNLVVDLLINNAGVGYHAAFLDSDLARQELAIQLNVVALMQLSYLIGQRMGRRGEGRILNVSSIAAFVSGPYMAIYHASKAFVQSFSEALAEELRGSGVTVTALCPGPTETGFEGVAGLAGSPLFSMLRPAKAQAVAAAGLRAAAKGQAVCRPGLVPKTMYLGTRLAPGAVARRFAAYLNGVLRDGR